MNGLILYNTLRNAYAELALATGNRDFKTAAAALFNLELYEAEEFEKFDAARKRAVAAFGDKILTFYAS